MKLFISAFLMIIARAAPAVAAAAAPTATTGEPKDVTATTATVPGTVNPNGTATTFVVEYGTTTAYGSSTPAQDAGSGVTPADVEAALTGLAPSTTYHARIVATNADGSSEGADVAFTTGPPPPTAPSVFTRSAVDVGPTSGRLRGVVDPNRAQTVWYFEYGTRTTLDKRTPTRTIAAGDDPVEVSAFIGDLPQNRRRYYRIVAESPAGTTRGAVRRFTTLRQPSRIVIKLSKPVVAWGTGLNVTGRVRGRGVSRIPVALERQDPVTGQWIQMSTTPADTKGRYTIAVPTLYALTRLRVITRTRIVAVSPQVWAYVAVRVGLSPRRAASKRRIRLEGSIFPAVPNAVASLQKRSPSGKWARIKRVRMTSSDENRSKYSFGIKRPLRGGRYRVAVLPRDEGLHVTGRSRVLRLKPQPAAKKRRANT